MPLSHAIQFLSNARLPPAARAATTGADQVMPSGERLTKRPLNVSPTISEFASQTPCSASYATTGSDARGDSPGDGENLVTPGSNPDRHVEPPLAEVEKPIAAAPPSTNRPFWKTLTIVDPFASEWDSSCVRCWPPTAVSGSFAI